MTLSQRYSGKFLAPWIDIAEWRSTRDLIYADSIESRNLALDRFKVWKLRTPLLSVGIEGTFILLEALLEEQKNLTSYEIAQIFSTALLRFLNICAANNDRQGTFYKTAEKNGLPYWLITLRHDIAHNHKIPAKSLLECALKECFKWIKEKYWDIQDLYMKDYVVCNKTNFKELFLDYAQLNLLEFFKENQVDLQKNIKKKLISIIPDSFQHLSSTKNILSILEDYLLESINTDKVKDSSNQIVSTLVDGGFILSVNSSNNDVKKIPADFVHIWHKTINVLYVNQTLFLLINKLMDVTEVSNFNNQEKEIASLWIGELYQGLMKAKKNKMNEENWISREGHSIPKSINDIINLEESVTLPIEDSVLFQQRILHNPNEFTMNYLEWVLKFNDNTNDFIKEQCKNIRNLVHFSPTFYTDASIIYSVRDVEKLLGDSRNDVEKMNTNNINVRKLKFRKLTDVEKLRFKGYPLGLCPPDY